MTTESTTPAGGHEDSGREDDTPAWGDEHPAFDTSIAHQARIYDYLLGGKDNFAADRAAAEALIAAQPDTVYMARENRAFLRRVVRFLAGEAGIRQFLDIGTGIPTAPNTHQIAQGIAAESRVVYIDYDPVVLAHARALTDSTPLGATDYLDADVRDTDAVLKKAARLLDFSEPVAVTMLALLHALGDGDDPYAIVARIMAAVPAGSYLAITHVSSDLRPEEMSQATERLNDMSFQQFTLRSHDEVMRFFSGLEMVEPGLVQVQQWRPEVENNALVAGWAGVGRK